MSYEFEGADPNRLCDLALAETAMRLVVEDFQKPSTVARSALTSALTLIGNLDERSTLAFLEEADELFEVLRNSLPSSTRD